jgi:replicative DNA helicase
MTVEKGLPANVDAERLVLGSVLLDDSCFDDVAILENDFALETHGRIFKRMRDLRERGERIDRVTVYHELNKHGEAEACGGHSYLVSLDDGMPTVPNIDSYIRLVQEKAIRRRAIFGAQDFINRCMVAEESDSQILLAGQKMLDALSDGQQKHGEWVTPNQVIQDYPGGPYSFLRRKQGGVGICTPWTPVTETLGGGLHKGDLVIIAGRPSMGKSIVTMQIAHQAAKDDHGAAMFSLEMSKESLTERLLCGVARVDCQKLRAGYLNATEENRLKSAYVDLEELPLRIDDTRARTIPAMTAALRKLIAKHPVEVVALDHLQLMTSIGRSREQKRYEELSEILHSLKHMAVTMDVAMVVACQLNRQCEIDNRKPQLSDLAETSAAEQDADVVMFVHRPERYAKNHNREDLRGRAEFIIAKQRCGPTGEEDMVFLADIQRFECRAAGATDGK